MKRRYLLLPVLAVGSASPAVGQDAGSLLRDRQQQADPTLPRPSEETVADPDAPVEERSDDGTRILVQSLRIEGDPSLLDADQRAALAARVEGQSVGFEAIRTLADAANTALRDNGHLLAQAVIPPQDATDGVLRLQLLQGSLEAVEIVTSEQVRARKSILAGVIEGRIDRSRLDRDGLESALLRLNDWPGLSARSRLAPGNAPGTTRLLVDVQQEPALGGVIHGDNFGSPSTGREQVHAQLSLTDLTGHGDLGVSASEGQRYFSAALSAPLAAEGMVVGVNYAYLDYENTDPVGELIGLEGRAHFATVSMQYQAVRSRRSNLRLTGSFNGKVLTDDSAVGRLSDKRIWSGTLGFSGDVGDDFLGGGVTQLSGGWTLGDLDLSRIPAAEVGDALGLRTQGTFHRLNADMARFQRLTDTLSLIVRGSGQWASKNLDSAESFSLGGPFGVRGWPVGEGRGDAGAVGTVELRSDFTLGKGATGLQLAAFLDAGWVRLNKDTNGIPPVNACACNSYSLSSVGLGATLRHRSITFAASWAHGIGDNPGRSAFDGTNVDGGTRRQQFWLSGSVRF